MQVLEKSLRSSLENVILEARFISETAARISLEALGVGNRIAFTHLDEDERRLRRRLRAHGRQLGDVLDEETGTQATDALIEEVAYQHWHRMLFARFLSENDLLMDDDPDTPIPLTLEECNDLAPSLGAKSGWDLAAQYASRMLPQIFKSNSPVFALDFPPERQKTLEQLITNIPKEVFHASDSLGWVYQFWQTKQKKEINESGAKIGSRELPAVTQLFTEPYMVSFLLDNSLGAWWATKRLSDSDFSLTTKEEQELREKASTDNLPLQYLRFVKNEELGSWIPAAGSFESWPNSLSEFKMLDPCCGSGHFLVAIFKMLVPMRMEIEGLDVNEAIRRVLEENIYGLELDQRCVELAAFALAFTAWTYPGSIGYRQLPQLNIAFSGQAIYISDEELIKLANGNADLYNILEDLKNKFKLAPTLGSLINPIDSIHENGLFSLKWEEINPLLEIILKKHQDENLEEAGVAAQGISKAASLLSESYNLVATNVPYLARGKQNQVLKVFCEQYFNDAKYNLATVFLDRCLQFCGSKGSVSLVLPQDWLFLISYEKFRKELLEKNTWNLIGRLGVKSFQTPMWDFNVQLFMMNKGKAKNNHQMCGIDVSKPKTVDSKSKELRIEQIKKVKQKVQLVNPDARIVFDEFIEVQLLNTFAKSYQGLVSADFPRYGKNHWEIKELLESGWIYQQGTVGETCLFGGRNNVIHWENGKGALANASSARIQGLIAWNNVGIAISQMGEIPVTIHYKSCFDNNTAVVIPNSIEDLIPIWCYCSSPEYNEEIREIDQSPKVTNATLVKIPFNFKHWASIAEKRYPNGLPLPFSNDPTQWIFHGHPCKSVIWNEEKKWTEYGPIRSDSTVLHVAVARLLGYQWPAELDLKMDLAIEQRELVSKCHKLHSYVDDDGIVCIPSVRGELSATERLLRILKGSYEDYWTDDTLSVLLRNVDSAGRGLESWLRDKFFIQHCKLFGNRPFIWQIWDGLPDGFSALVNYHKFDYKKLETLIYTYLGDWLQRQKMDVENKIEGATERLIAAQHLSQTLELILEGEAPFDIFTRWKNINEQPIGWNPDLNDGVRINIRPFLSVPDIGKKGAGVLRDKPNIKWTRDRGRDIEGSPWYNLGPLYGGKKGDRVNEHHLTLQEKQNAIDK